MADRNSGDKIINDDILDVNKLLENDAFMKTNDIEIFDIVQNWLNDSRESLSSDDSNVYYDTCSEMTDCTCFESTMSLSSNIEEQQASDDTSNNGAVRKQRMIEVAVEPFDLSNGNLDEETYTATANNVSIVYDGKAKLVKNGAKGVDTNAKNASKLKAPLKLDTAVGHKKSANSLGKSIVKQHLSATEVNKTKISNAPDRLSMKKPSAVPKSIYQRSKTFTIDSIETATKELQKRRDKLNIALATPRMPYKP